ARARERDAGWYIDYGWTRPRVVSRGPVPQGLPVSGGADASGAAAEELPTAEPTPAQPPTGGTDISPLPPPQETRVSPRISASRPAVVPAAYVNEEVAPQS